MRLHLHLNSFCVHAVLQSALVSSVYFYCLWTLFLHLTCFICMCLHFCLILCVCTACAQHIKRPSVTVAGYAAHRWNSPCEYLLFCKCDLYREPIYVRVLISVGILLCVFKSPLQCWLLRQPRPIFLPCVGGISFCCYIYKNSGEVIKRSLQRTGYENKAPRASFRGTLYSLQTPPGKKILQLQREHNPGQGTATTEEVRFSVLENSFSRKLENAAN